MDADARSRPPPLQRLLSPLKPRRPARLHGQDPQRPSGMPRTRSPGPLMAIEVRGLVKRARGACLRTLASPGQPWLPARPLPTPTACRCCGPSPCCCSRSRSPPRRPSPRSTPSPPPRPCQRHRGVSGSPSRSHPQASRRPSLRPSPPPSRRPSRPSRGAHPANQTGELYARRRASDLRIQCGKQSLSLCQVPSVVCRVRGRRRAGHRPLRLLRARRVRPGRGGALLRRGHRHRPLGTRPWRVRRQHGLRTPQRPHRSGVGHVPLTSLAIAHLYTKCGFSSFSLFFRGRCCRGCSLQDQPEALCVCRERGAVCGSDNATYASSCQMQMRSVRAAADETAGPPARLWLKHRGPCRAGGRAGSRRTRTLLGEASFID